MASSASLLVRLSVLFFAPPRYCWLFPSWISLSQPLMVRQPRAENQSVFRRRDHAGSLLDASPPPHLGASSLLRRLLPKSESASGRRACSAPAARNPGSDGIEAQAHASGSRLLGSAIPVLVALERHLRHRQAGHRDSLAPQGVPPVLAGHFEAWSRATADP